MEFKIVDIKLENRNEIVLPVQNTLTEYGCYIKVRLGLHNLNKETCSQDGSILLELIADNNLIDEFLEKSNSINGTTAKKMLI
ncbi:hypothetical protein [Psychrilyobacter sp.]|uniref:hypothetical protein n=1 Tax=Psychrilyobacter sp. TaxID=2586924 RepID=UPI003019CC93